MQISVIIKIRICDTKKLVACGVGNTNAGDGDHLHDHNGLWTRVVDVAQPLLIDGAALAVGTHLAMNFVCVAVYGLETFDLCLNNIFYNHRHLSIKDDVTQRFAIHHNKTTFKSVTGGNKS
jgi:hypothetical protein